MKNLVYVIFLLLIVSCNAKQNHEKTTDEKKISVKIAEVKSERIEVNLNYSGSVEASQTIPLNFQTTGKVEKVLADAGDNVKKGQVLALLEKNDLLSMNEITKAKLEQAKDAYDRLKVLHEKGSLSDIKWIEMQTNLEQAKSSYELSLNNLNKCNLVSPIDGIVGKRNIEPGMSSITLTSSPMEIVDIKTIYIKISVPENEIGKIKKGIKAKVKVSALDNRTYEGEINNVSPVAETFSRTYPVKIKVNNSQLELKPGMVCDVTLNIKSKKDVLLVPYQSVSKDREGNSFVFIADITTKTAKKQIVKTGNYSGNNLEILSGLSSGQKIVNEGKEKLSDNSLISF